MPRPSIDEDESVDEEEGSWPLLCECCSGLVVEAEVMVVDDVSGSSVKVVSMMG
jgi:hypothetical protein